ncbi:MAG: metal ABC transporter permease [Solobacterium sp.]|nr:metal ABC transporter permease [Solobacterium sp.]
MISMFIKMLSYPFLQRALLVGLLVSLCASLLGTSLVMKRFSMIGDGLSHVGFAALALAYALNLAPLSVSVPVCVLAAFFLLRIRDSSKIKGDAATALMCSGALAVGVMTISLTSGMNTDVCNYMFGSILAMSRSDVVLSVVLALAVIVLYVIFYHRIFAVTFDESFAEATGINTNAYNTVIAVLTAVTVVLGMRMMGTLLISSLIVFPSLTAMRVTGNYHSTVVVSALISTVCFLAGLFFSYLYSVPTGACIVIMNMLAFFVFSLAAKRKGA